MREIWLSHVGVSELAGELVGWAEFRRELFLVVSRECEWKWDAD